MSGGSPQVRTLHLCHTTDRRGAELSTVHLVAALRERGLDSRTIALRPGSEGDQLDLPVLGRHGRTPLAIARLRRQLRTTDVLVAHGASALLTAYAAQLGSSVPFLYRMIGDPAFWGDVRLRDLRVSRPLRAASRVVTLWQGAADDAQRLHHLRADQLEVIVNGRDERALRPGTAEERVAARAQLGLPADRTVVGYLGALRWEKDPLLAVAAIDALGERGAVPGVHLAMAGDGDQRADVEAAAARSGRVSVLGTTNDVQSFLWACDALVLTSKTEGLPGVVIEAGLCGVPVVAPDVGGTADLVDATTGVLVPRGSGAEAYADALEHVLGDPAMLGRALEDRCRRSFTVGAAADRWVELLTRTARP